jgi:hypothetical protein
MQQQSWASTRLTFWMPSTKLDEKTPDQLFKVTAHSDS